MEFNIGNRVLGEHSPTYFIADVASNHDGDLHKAKDLIFAAAEAGADAAKFQHFRAKTLISQAGFSTLGKQIAHQSTWNKSVYEVYKAAETDIIWTQELFETCKKAGIDFFSSVYDLQAIDAIEQFVDVFKVGSGDIDWLEGLEIISRLRKPVIVATGASELDEVHRVFDFFDSKNIQIALLQCNTNYSGSDDVFYHMNLNVLTDYKSEFPETIIGLSDHSRGHTAVLGAIALGARIIEKHFTLDNDSQGPDHSFSLNPNTWSEMVRESRFLERSLGDGQKRVEKNELETVIVQRRGLYASRDLSPGESLSTKNTVSLRPRLEGQLSPWRLYGETVLTARISKDMPIFDADVE